MQTVGNPRKRSEFIDVNCQLSIRYQCRLLNIHRSLVYYRLSGESAENLRLMKQIDVLHVEDPSAGSRRLSRYLTRLTDRSICRKRVRRLMGVMGLETIYPRQRTTIPGGPSGIHSYLLRGIDINRPNQVWAANITYIPMQKGFTYLFAIVDWFSRKTVAGKLSNTLDAQFCSRCLKRALLLNVSPDIMNTDQWCHFTSEKQQAILTTSYVKICMVGKRRWIDNVVIERFWRTIKYEEIYLQSYCSPNDLEQGIARFMLRYNSIRPHDSLGGQTPDEVYLEKLPKVVC